MLVDATRRAVEFYLERLRKASDAAGARSYLRSRGYDADVVTFEDDQGAYDQRDAGGFIKLNALRLRVAAKLEK